MIFKLKKNLTHINWNKFHELEICKTTTELYQNLLFSFLNYVPNIQQLTYIDLYNNFNDCEKTNEKV